MTQIGEHHIGFHEATVIDITNEGMTFNIRLEDVVVDGTPKAVEFAIGGVESILRNGISSACLRMEKTGGELLRLKEAAGHIVLVVQWDDYDEHTRDITVYELRGHKVALRVVGISPNLEA